MTKKISLVLALALLGFSAAASASVSFSIGTDNFYLSVGDYDYLPYAYEANPEFVPPKVSFYAVMNDYGTWVSVSPFGQCWQPYASYGWKPYLYGHWIYTRYGPTWQGYEPWAWVGYHYGAWILSDDYGWVWVPGYDWHPGRVSWAYSYNAIGWTPLPPDGYDYSRGHLSYVGPTNQFTYADDDFSISAGTQAFSYGGPYYNPRYQSLYYNPAYSNINVNLWIFVDNSNFESENYAGAVLGADYTRYVFDRRLIRISNRQIEKPVLERVVRQRIEETPVDVKELQTDKQPVKLVVPTGGREMETIRKHGNEVVREVIAPSFAAKQKTFKGLNAKNKDSVTKVFHQENVQPQVETLSSDQVLQRANEVKQNRDEQVARRAEAARNKVASVEKQGGIHPPEKQPQPVEPPQKEQQRQSKPPAYPNTDRQGRQIYPEPPTNIPPQHEKQLDQSGAPGTETSPAIQQNPDQDKNLKNGPSKPDNKNKKQQEKSKSKNKDKEKDKDQPQTSPNDPGTER